jgi:hypothetical protein
MSEDVQETTEAWKARQYKAEVSSLLEELIPILNRAKDDGFVVQFNLGLGAEQQFCLSSLSISKQW